MQKRKLFIIFAVLITISLIGLSAQCGLAGQAPTIKIEIYDGPDYSESDDMCYYRAETSVTGSPGPEVTFGDDDNIKLLGSNRVEVGVKTGDSYTLTAIATNPSGTASVSIVLKGECGEEEAVEDAEEEDIDEAEEEPGGEETEEAEEEEEEAEEEEEEAEVVEDVHSYYFSAIADPALSGFITQDTGVTTGTDSVNIGDNIDDRQIKGYISFDISSLSDITADDASVTISDIELIRHPEDISATMRIKYFEYGTLDMPDFAAGGITIGDWEIIGMDSIRFDYAYTSFIDSLNAAINDPDIDYYQLKLGINGTNNGDGRSDLITFDLTNAILEITYYQ